MEYLHRESRDVPFGWVELLRAAFASSKAARRSEPLRLPAPDHFPASPAR